MLFQPRQDYLGIDISDLSLRIVQFRRTLTGALTLAGMSSCDLAPEIFAEGELKDANGFVTALKQMIAKPQVGRFTTAYTVACLPETKTFIKVIDIPPMPLDEIPQAIKWEAEHHIPIPIDDTYWDWQQVGTPSKSNARLPILLGVSPKAIVDSYDDALRRASLVPVAMEIEAVAIARSLLPLDPPDNASATMIIDLGATRTSLIVFDHQTIQFTASLPISGRHVTQQIAATLSITEEQAEKAKLVCGLDPKKCHGAMREILHGTMDALVRSINEATIFYHEHFPQGHEFGEVLLCGGGANFKYIDEYMGERLKLKVERGNPWRNLGTEPPPMKPGDLLPYTTSIGLALRTLNGRNNHD